MSNLELTPVMGVAWMPAVREHYDMLDSMLSHIGSVPEVAVQRSNDSVWRETIMDAKVDIETVVGELCSEIQTLFEAKHFHREFDECYEFIWLSGDEFSASYPRRLEYHIRALKAVCIRANTYTHLNPGGAPAASLVLCHRCHNPTLVIDPATGQTRCITCVPI